MKAFPLFINLENKKCLVVGGGKVAVRRVRVLLNFEADITVVSPEFCPSFDSIKSRVNLIQGSYDRQYLNNAFMVIAASNDTVINTRVYMDAVRMGIHVSCADDKEKCTFLFPSVVNRGEVTVGITTSGGYPLLSKYLRGEIEKIIPEHLQNMMDILESYREKILSERPDEKYELMEKVLMAVLNGEENLIERLDEITSGYVKAGIFKNLD